MRLTTMVAVVLGLIGSQVSASAEPQSPASPFTVSCGQEGQVPCSTSEARFESKQAGLCAPGQIFDIIEGGTCWTCPAGFGRTIFAVNRDQACEKVSTLEFRRADEHGKGTGFFGTDCSSGRFWDIVDGNCHSCPSGYAMQVFEHVHSANKCAKTIPASFAVATKVGPPCGAGQLWDPRNGGECWRCPTGFVRTIAPVNTALACEYKGIGGVTGLRGCGEGLSSIRNVCQRTGVCGKADQRPCEIGERIPSCDEGLKEDFKVNKCLTLLPGETPFTAGISSLAGFFGSTLQLRCKQLLGGISSTFDADFGVGARCGRDVTIGFACAVVRDIGAGYIDIVNSLLEKVPEGASLADEMNKAAAQPPCSDKSERFAKATKHGRGTGLLKTDCPSGQFWDPDGSCYSCPADYTRTLFPVSHDRACTDKFGGNLARFACGAGQGVIKHFDTPMDCTVEVVKDGSIFDQKIDLNNANQAKCMATGELGYYIVRTGIAAGKAVATGDISDILATIGKVKSSVSNVMELSRVQACSKQ